MLFEVHILSYHTFFNFGAGMGGDVGRDTLLKAEGKFTVVASIAVESLFRNAAVWSGYVARFGSIVHLTARGIHGEER